MRTRVVIGAVLVLGSIVAAWSPAGAGARLVGPVPGNVTRDILAGGTHHACLLLPDGSVRCSGFNAQGQLGDGTTTNRILPTPVNGLTDAVSIVAGPRHTCALRANGTVSCWGENGAGQLGDGTTTNRLVPTAVANLTEVHGRGRFRPGTAQAELEAIVSEHRTVVEVHEWSRTVKLRFDTDGRRP